MQGIGMIFMIWAIFFVFVPFFQVEMRKEVDCIGRKGRLRAANPICLKQTKKGKKFTQTDKNLPEIDEKRRVLVEKNADEGEGNAANSIHL